MVNRALPTAPLATKIGADGESHSMSHGSEHAGGHAEPKTELGRAIKALVSAAPPLVAALTSSADDHGHHHDGDDVLDLKLRKLIEEIREGLEKMRNPAGLIANCDEALR